MAVLAPSLSEQDLPAGLNDEGAKVMPSPFPGMDPYLEGSTWMNFHGQLCAEIARQLSPKLRPRYLARLTERFFTDISVDSDVSKQPLYPDIGVVERDIPSSGGESFGIATAPIRVATEMPESILHFAVEIRDMHERRLVTSIEVLSPSNKRGDGREEYLAKRRRVLLGTAHLIEIDLLRKGQRLPMKEPLPPAPYYAYVGRFEIRPVTDVWPISLERALPQIPIPLLAEDPDVMLDLQLALTTVYDLSDYDLEIDYTKPPDMSFSPKEAAWSDWSDSHLRSVGLRT
jgi:hypothetical protein